MKMDKNIINALNAMAQTDFKAADAVLSICNPEFGNRYGWLNKRVVYFDNPNGSVAERYAHVHDALYE